MDNPFEEGEHRLLRPPATALVIFGASGDLTHRKLLPALVNLAQDDYLPNSFIVVGAARSKFTDEEFRASIKDSVDRFSRQRITSEVWKSFAERIYYQPLDGNNSADFLLLKDRLRLLEAETNCQYNYLYYFATAPNFFGPISENLKVAGLIEKPGASTFKSISTSIRRTGIVVEKPFGHDLTSARELNDQLRANFAEEQIFRIDHYLGKETVQNILVFRFGNSMFEPLWNSRYIDCIQISVCEDFGVGSRAGYFDENGILRDIVQNHVLQMLSLLCIEPPISLNDADSIRDEKVKVLKMMKRISISEVANLSVRARYSSGYLNGAEVSGYLAESGIPPTSSTETYVALKVEIDNWRWAGVPIFIRAGKCLPKRITEVSVLFKQPPSTIFRGREIGALERNVLSIQVQPKEGISLDVNSKPPGPRMRVRRVGMNFTYDDSFGVPSPDAYERLLLDAMKGDATLFTRDDEIEEAWSFLAPVFSSWESVNPPPLYEYSAGTWGPDAANKLIESDGFYWRKL